MSHRIAPSVIAISFAAILHAGCDTGEASSEVKMGAVTAIARDIDTLQRIKRTPQLCFSDAQCPAGSHCDDDADECRWECLADSDCGPGWGCSADGSCMETISVNSRSDTPACQAVPFPERRELLLGLNDEQRICADDEDCPCGAYCASDATCRVECMAEEPANPILNCETGESCTPLGRCASSPTDPGPQIELTLEIDPALLVANSAAAPVLVETEITAIATSLDVLDPLHPAEVLVAFAERNDPDPNVMPRVKCAELDPLADSCELNGGWIFQPSSGSLRSLPRTVWVEIPQLADDEDWTLEASSEWADLPATAMVRAAPVANPPTDGGEYSGELTWPQDGGEALTLDVTAIVTPTHIAIFESTRVLFPVGHAVFARDQSAASIIAWLNAEVSPGTAFSVRMDLGPLAYEQATGRLTGGIEKLTFEREEALSFKLTRTGPVASPTCSSDSSCATGTYCNKYIGLCLPGTSSPDKILADPPSWLTNDLRSGLLQSWLSPLTSMVSQNARFQGSDIIGIERAYCSQSPSEATPARLGHNTSTPSRDLVCHDPTADGITQKTFAYANRTTEVEAPEGAETFNLLDTCLADLNVQPSGTTAASLLPNKDCVSLGRFLLALRANVMSPRQSARKLLVNILRQWLTVNAFVARTTVQEQDYEDTLQTQGAPTHERFGGVVDLMERAWRLLLDPRVRVQYVEMVNNDAVQAVDYRRINRPVLHWHFNTPPNTPLPITFQDTENNHDLLTLASFAETDGDRVLVTDATNGLCSTSASVALDERGFSLVGFVGSLVHGRYRLLEKAVLGGTPVFWIELEWAGAQTVTVDVKDNLGGLARFSIPLSSGYYAFVVEEGKYRIYRRPPAGGIETFSPSQLVNGGPKWGGNGPVRMACDLPRNGVDAPHLIYDEISFWSRPLPPETILAMANPYFDSSGVPVHSVVTKPPLGTGGIQQTAGDEQPAGLALHLLEAANAGAELLHAYVEAERGVMYEECYLDGTSTARDRVIGRVGRGLRLLSLLEGDAASLNPHSSLPWYPRYAANQVELAGTRRKLLEVVRLAEACTNPLGITEDDLPLFHGVAVGSSERFFASSRFLTQRARQEIDAATAGLFLAQNAYWQQRLSQFQVTLSQTEKEERLRKLNLDYEGVLRRYCGTPAGNQKLLPSFLDGTMTPSNCFFKTELQGCQIDEDTPIADVPARCLRGDLGGQILAIQGAGIDVENATENLHRSLMRYDAEMDYCARRQAHHEQSDAILLAHQEHMERNRKQQRKVGLIRGIVDVVVKTGVAAATQDPKAALDAFLSNADLVTSVVEAGLQESAAEAEARYQLVVQMRSEELDLMACYHTADMHKFAFDDARDVIKGTLQDVTTANFGLENARNELAALIDEASGQIAVEGGIDRTPPHHHFWLDDHIDTYRRHLRYARRLTYLSLRSFEYESQQSIGLRGQVMTANHPDTLLEVVEEIEARNAPMQGEQGYVIGEGPVVLSLRDEILRLEDLANNSQREPGDPPITSEEAFRIFLRSPSARIYDRSGQYLGQGIRFEMRPGGWAQTSCAERTWRVTTSLQMVGTLNNAQMVLLQENAFASQDCHAAESALRLARIRPHHNLLLGEFPVSYQPPSVYTPMNVDGLINRTRQEMENMVEGRHEGFAGRGLYGGYLLLFPSQQFPDSVLASLKDVLIRFDIVEVTNVDL